MRYLIEYKFRSQYSHYPNLLFQVYYLLYCALVIAEAWISFQYAEFETKIPMLVLSSIVLVSEILRIALFGSSFTILENVVNLAGSAMIVIYYIDEEKLGKYIVRVGLFLIMFTKILNLVFTTKTLRTIYIIIQCSAIYLI